MHVAAPSPTLVDTYRRGIEDLSALALKDLVDLIKSARGGGPEAVKLDLERYLPLILDQYGVVASDLGAEFYQESRLSAGVTSRFVAEPTPWAVEDGRIVSLIRWGVSPEYMQSQSTTEMLIGGALQRLVLSGFRDSIGEGVVADRSAYGYARKPQAGCCAFCAMVSTRVYESAEVATRVQGRRSRKRVTDSRGMKSRVETSFSGTARGTQGLGDKYHDFCRCTPVPVFDTGGDMWADVAAVNPEAESFLDAYTKAWGEYADAGYPGKSQASEVLKRMRAYGYR